MGGGDIRKPLPGSQAIQYYKWYDYFSFAQDTWQVHPTLFLSLVCARNARQRPGKLVPGMTPSRQPMAATRVSPQSPAAAGPQQLPAPLRLQLESENRRR